MRYYQQYIKYQQVPIRIRLLKILQSIPFISRRRVKNKRRQIVSLRDQYYYAIQDIISSRYDKKSLYELEEYQMDELLSMTQEELIDVQQRVEKKRNEEESRKRNNYIGTTKIYLVNMDIMTIVDADLNRIKEEIEATEKDLEKIECVSMPDSATDAQKAALIKLQKYSVEYQSRHKTLRAKLEYLRCAYDELMDRKEVDRLIRLKRSFDAYLDSY